MITDISNKYLVHKEYWNKKLVIEKDNFWNKYSQNIVNRKHSHYVFQLDSELCKKLIWISNKSEVRMMILLLAGIYLLMYKIFRIKNVVIGTSILKQKELKDFINTELILKNDLDENNSFKDLLNSIKDDVTESVNNQNFPIRQLINFLNKEIKLDCVFIYDNLQKREYIEDFNSGTIFSFNKENDSIFGTIEYDREQFNENEIISISNSFQRLLQNAVKDVDLPLKELPVYVENEFEDYISSYCTGEKKDIQYRSLLEMFNEQVVQNPHKVAIRNCSISEESNLKYIQCSNLTFNELNNKANGFARNLISHGIEAGGIIGILLNSSDYIPEAIISVLKTGNAFLPLTPDLPEHRLSLILKDSNIMHLITTQVTKRKYKHILNQLGIEIHLIDEDFSDTSQIDYKFSDEDLAYIIYTSGSTGVPKGVMVNHKGLVAYTCFRIKNYEYSSMDTTLQLLNYSFDGYYSNFLSSLLSGGILVLVQNEIISDYNLLIDLIEKNLITNTSSIPRMLESIFSLMNQPKFRFIVVAGEKISISSYKAIKNKIGNTRIINEYGLTESSIGTLVNENVNLNNLSIGKPIWNSSAFILNEHLEHVPAGLQGEIYLSGDSIARGYLNNPELTNTKFKHIDSHQVCLKTGDQGLFLGTKNIEYIDRNDKQVKIRGYRIELSEIKNCLLSFDAIEDAVVTTYKSNGNELFIIAYLISPSSNVEQVRAYLNLRLPEYMIPSKIVLLDKFPINNNGKIDFTKLKNNHQKDDDNTLLKNKTEIRILEIWNHILKTDTNFDVNSNFFEVGGHSINASLLISKIHAEFGVKVFLVNFFKSPTISFLAREIESGIHKNQYSRIPKVSKKDSYLATSSQRRMFISQYGEPDSTSYNIPFAIEIVGKVDIQKIEDVFKVLIQRHDNFRTSFNIDGQNIIQKVHYEVPFKINIVNCKDINIEEEIEDYINVFDLQSAPLINVSLLKDDKDKNILLIDIHHIILDYYSLETLKKEFVGLLANNNFEAPRLQYKDYAEWSSNQQNKENYRKQLRYWQGKLKGKEYAMDLPIDFDRPEIVSDYGDSVSFEIDKTKSDSLREIAKNEGLTLYTLLLSIYNLVMYKICNSEHVSIGLPTSGRNHPELENILGVFINLFVFNCEIKDDDNFIDLLHNVNLILTEAQENQDVNFEELVENMGIEWRGSRHPFFDTIFSVDYLEDDPIEFDDFTLKHLHLDRKVAKYDLEVMVNDQDRLLINIQYRTQLFKYDSIEKIIQSFLNVIDKIVSNPNIQIMDV